MVPGPATPPSGTGSANLTLPANNGGDSSALRGSGFAGIALTSITTLQYSTYDTANNGQQFPYFGLVVSADGAARLVDTLFFEPPFQQKNTGNPSLPNQNSADGNFNNSALQNQWLTWNALGGAWWDNNGLSQAGNGPGHSLSFDDLLSALATSWSVAEGDIKIVNTTDDLGNPLGGVRFDVGFADSTSGV